MANLVDIATLLGLGGLVGVLAGLAAAGKRFSAHLSELALTIEKVLKDPRHADLGALAKQARAVEQDAKSLMGMLRQVLKG